jgi:Rrf2 family iron-sulfur cluster assembly transcriptional regulator
MTHDLWTNLNKKMFAYLDSVSLADLVAQQQRRLESAVLHDGRPEAHAHGAEGAALVAG